MKMKQQTIQLVNELIEIINRKKYKFIKKILFEIQFKIIQTIAIISGVIIISGLSYYYFDEIKDGLGSSIE
jgi:cytochrome b subunit of formate dehydrogenase